MVEATRAERDPENITFSGELSNILGQDGNLSTFHRRKFGPSIEAIIENGMNHTSAILDIGIGYGAFLRLLEENGFKNHYGMDQFPRSIEMASTMTRAVLRNGRIEDADWPFDFGSFDCITAFDVIEHLERPSMLLSKAKAYLRPRGLLLVTTPLKEFGYRMRNLPWIGIPDTNPTHINVHAPKYWLDLVNGSCYTLEKCWRGETLSHIKWSWQIDRVLRSIRIDARKVPILRSLEQSFLLLLRKK